MKTLTMRRAASLWSIAVLAFCGVAWSQTPAPNALSNPEPSVRLTRAQAAQFQTAIDQIAAQGKVAFVAEGVPLISQLKPAKVPDFLSPIPLSQAVVKLADAYDYDAARKDGVFVLTKRYADARDLPDVTLDECRLAAADVLRMMEPFNPHVKNGTYEEDPILPPFIASLSPEQEQAMRNKTLRFGDLAPNQKALIMQAFLYFHVGVRAFRVSASANLLEGAPQSKLWAAALSQSQGAGGTLGPVTEERGLFIETPPSRYRHPIGTTSVQEDAALMADVDTARKQKSQEKPTPPAGRTLAQVIADISRKVATPWEVDGALAEKRVSVAGLENAPALDVMRGLVQVYGLHIGVGKDNVPRLNRRAVLPATDLRRMPATLWAVMPDPVQRAFFVHRPAPTRPILPVQFSKNPVEAKREMEEAMRTFDQGRDQWDGRPQAMRGEAARRLALALPAAWAKSNKPLPVSALDEPPRSLLGLVLLCQVADILRGSFNDTGVQRMTRALDRIDAMIISGSPQVNKNCPGVKLHSLYLNVPDTDGKSINCGGVTFGTDAGE